MKNKKEEIWIFVLREGLLPGRFEIQPIEPSVIRLIREDPELTILKHMYMNYIQAQAEYEAYVKYTGHYDIDVLAKKIAHCIEKNMGIPKAFVIPSEEFNKRVYRGEFENLGEFTIQQRLDMGHAFRMAMSSVIENYYSGLPEERQEEVFHRLQVFDMKELPVPPSPELYIVRGRE